MHARMCLNLTHDLIHLQSGFGGMFFRLSLEIREHKILHAIIDKRLSHPGTACRVLRVLVHTTSLSQRMVPTSATSQN